MVKKEGLLNYFRVLKDNNLLGSSYLFLGQNYPLVFDILKLISCKEDSYFCNFCLDCKRINQNNHPDLLVIEPENLTIKIETIRDIRSFLSLKSFCLERKIVILKESESLSPEAANAFLKTLEEPPKNSFIALCALRLEGLLPTISSRCRKIFLPSVDTAIEQADINLAYSFLQGEDLKFEDRKAFGSFLWALIETIRCGLLWKANCQNNKLPFNKGCEIILGNKNIVQISGILRDLLKIYRAYHNININLAMNLIKGCLDWTPKWV